MALEMFHLGDKYYKQAVLLESHGIETKIENDKLIILETSYFRDGSVSSQWIDASDYTIKQIKEFLGY